MIILTIYIYNINKSEWEKVNQQRPHLQQIPLNRHFFKIEKTPIGPIIEGNNSNGPYVKVKVHKSEHPEKQKMAPETSA